MSELQPGMLALVVGCVRNPVNIGKTVTLSREAFDGDIGPDSMPYSGDRTWLITGESLVCVDVLGRERKSSYSYAKSEHLMPIKPEADPLHVTHKEELHA
jgi:hypothetical protein